MTTRSSKQHTNGTALLEESVLDKRVPAMEPAVACVEGNQIDGRTSDVQPEKADVDENQIDERSSDTQLGTQQFVTFLSGDEVFAADMSPVKEIIRVPQVVRVPLAPPALEGLANLRGKVLPIISLRRLFGFPELEHDDSTRALVIDVGQPLGFVVDRVSSVMGVDAGHIEDVGSISTTVNTEVLSGLIKDAGGHAMIMVLDFAKLVQREFSQIAAITKNTSVASAAQAQVQSEEEDSSDELQLVSFNVEGQEYAIAIEDVQEIVQVPEAVIHVPHSESHVLGVMTLRNRLLPLVSLRSMFGMAQSAIGEQSRIVVVGHQGQSIGLVTDTVKEVLRVPLSLVDPLPGLLSSGSGLREIDQICRMDGGKRLVAILLPDRLFTSSAVQDALGEVAAPESGDEMTGQTETASRQADDEEQYVVFRVADEEYGVPIEVVQEIVRIPDQLTRVPKAPDFIEGVVNLRGAVLPVIDQRRRFSLPDMARNDRQRIMVFMIRGVRTGFIVDSVSEVLKILRSQISSAPDVATNEDSAVSRVANIVAAKRMILMLDVERLLSPTETHAMKLAS